VKRRLCRLQGNGYGLQEFAMESRRITAGMGLLFTALGAWIAFEIAADWPGYLAAGAVGGLGIDAIYSAVRGRRSLMSRIGPLP
jgi:hypothetical protein